MAKEAIEIEAAGREVRLSSPSKVFFAEPGFTKRDLAEYYLAVADAACLHLRERPTTMKRFVDGAGGEFFFQKRVPKTAPDWLETATVKFPSGRSATELCANDAAHLVWAVNLGVIDFNPWPARRADLDHPDELRVDLDPTPESNFGEVREVAMCVREVLADHGLRGFPKTSGSRGIHVNVRIEPQWDFTEVRRAALALAREVERRTKLATSKWWKEERHGVFVDYNQNARDRTVASAWSVRPTPDARVSTPLEWDEVPDVEPDRAAARHGPGAARRARRPLGDDRRRPPLARLAARARRPRRGRGARRRAMAAALPQAEGRAEAGAAEPGEEGLAVEIREATVSDWEQIWPFFRQIVRAAETYAYDPEMAEGDAREIWMVAPPGVTFVAVVDGSVVGTANAYANRDGPGSHVASGSFLVDPARAGRGIGRALGERVIEWARAEGFRSIQFNAVVETNVRATALWRSLGFELVGTVPEAFRLPDGSLTGLHVMYRPLGPR